MGLFFIVMIGLLSHQNVASNILQTETLGRNDHESLCNFRYSSQLTSIHNANENEAAKQICYEPCYIGLNYDNVQYYWSDDTPFDYGNTFTNPPWAAGRPSHGNSVDCVALWSVNPSALQWYDEDATVCNALKLFGLCNPVPSTYLINDNQNIKRKPIRGYDLGFIDILDDIHIEFNLFINWCTTCTQQNTSILQIGNNETEAFPDIFLNNNEYLCIQFTSVSSPNSLFVFHLNISTVYHVIIFITQSNFTFVLNNSTILKQNIASHSILFGRFIYLSNAYKDAANVTLNGLMISSSNSVFPNDFNYLCDFSRFTHNGIGTWIQSTPCQIQQTNGAERDIQLWLGDIDPSSLKWSDYNIELIMSISNGHSTLAGTYASLTFRQQSISPNDDGGKHYEIAFDEYYNKIRFLHIDNGWSVQNEANYVITDNVDYTLRVHAVGNIFHVYIDNELLFVETRVENEYAVGSVGLITYNAVVTFKSLKIKFPTRDLVTNNPTISPSVSPTNPTTTPTTIPTITPTVTPSEIPSVAPSRIPSFSPSYNPSLIPSSSPLTNVPSIAPSIAPSIIPSFSPNISQTVVSSIISTENGAQKKDKIDDKSHIIFVLVSILITMILCTCIVGFYYCWQQKKKKHMSTIAVSTTQMTDRIITSKAQRVQSLSKTSDVNNVNDLGESDDEDMYDEVNAVATPMTPENDGIDNKTMQNDVDNEDMCGLGIEGNSNVIVTVSNIEQNESSDTEDLFEVDQNVTPSPGRDI